MAQSERSDEEGADLEEEREEDDEEIERPIKKTKKDPPKKKAAQPKKQQKTPLVKLRAGVQVTEEELKSASAYLPILPKNFKWTDDPRLYLANEPWNPTHENDPQNTPNLNGRCLTSIFLEMLDEPLQLVVKHTNTSGEKLFPLTWKRFTVDLMMAMIAALFYMDVTRVADIKMYWRKKRPDQFIKKLGLSKKKFSMYLKALRLYDPAEYSEAQKKANKIYKAEQFIDVLCKQFQKMRHPPGRSLSVDEEMAKFQGRSKLIQIIKGKPTSKGLKYYLAGLVH